VPLLLCSFAPTRRLSGTKEAPAALERSKCANLRKRLQKIRIFSKIFKRFVLFFKRFVLFFNIFQKFSIVSYHELAHLMRGLSSFFSAPLPPCVARPARFGCVAANPKYLY
jgi:hypothetical protein